MMFGLYINKMKIIAFFDRWYNIIFNTYECLEFWTKYPIEYNKIVEFNNSKYRSLGNNWYKAL